MGDTRTWLDIFRRNGTPAEQAEKTREYLDLKLETTERSAIIVRCQAPAGEHWPVCPVLGLGAPMETAEAATEAAIGHAGLWPDHKVTVTLTNEITTVGRRR